VSPEDFGRLFESFALSAFRLETLPAYNVPQDAESLAAFRAGHERPQARDNRPWLTTTRNAIARGARMQRVRVVQTPLTEYQRFQFSWGYVENSQAGEEIAILDYVPAGIDTLEDFWLFDDATVVVLKYAADGSFIRPAEVSDVAPYLKARDAALAAAVPFDKYRNSSRVRQGLPYWITDDDVLDQAAMLIAPMLRPSERDEPRPSRDR